MIELMVVLLMYFSRMVKMILVLWEFTDKTMLLCFRRVKCHDSYTPAI